MVRKATSIVLLLMASTTLGCAMCASPYDYTSPVPGDGLGFNDRAGSILQGVAPSDDMIGAEVSQEAIGESVTEGAPLMESIEGRPTPAPGLGPQSRRIESSQIR